VGSQELQHRLYFEEHPRRCLFKDAKKKGVAMNQVRRRAAIPLLLIAFAAVGQVYAADVTLHQVTFPEKKTIDVEFSRTRQAPMATLKADVKIFEGQAQIELKFQNMKPAVLFGGDVTSYVLWAITRDGTTENLGELWVREDSDKIEYSTGLKSFAMLVTGESYPLVTKPSELVLFTSQASDSKRAESSPFLFSDLGPAPDVGMDSIAGITWDSSKPLDVVQAEKAYEIAEREGALEYTPQIMKDARFALGQARNFSAARKSKQTIDYSRRSVFQSGEAIQITKRRKEREEIERQIEQRRKEMEALEARAKAAEEQSQLAQAQLKQAEAALVEAGLQQRKADEAIASTRQELTSLEQQQLALQQEKTQLVTEKEALLAEKNALLAEKNALLAEKNSLAAEKEALLAEKNALAAEKTTLVAEKAALQAQQDTLQQSIGELEERAERLKQEREQLSARLEGALSQVAETRDSARGLIVNLPDILFDLNEATLKQEARIVIAKLAGILLIMREQNLRVEGHTDSTGTEEYNQGLSERRAASVRDFLSGQGINMNRMVAVGYGERRPVADNESKEGRKKNRRVEIIIAQGEVAEAQ
jgi:outer membrane protein OmpA-like peptidoglycan-associated protein